MQVKCPKCRYRYDADCDPGINELACVCPRCGTPFTHVVAPDEVGNVASVPVNDASPEPLQPSSTTSVASDHEPSNTVSDNGKPEFAPWSDTRSDNYTDLYRSSNHRDHMPPMPDMQQMKRRGCLSRNCFLLFVIIVCLFVFGLRGCHNDDSYTASDIEEKSEVAMNFGEKNDTLNRYPREEDAVPLPDWVYGTWSVNTDCGRIEVRIAGKWIRETIDGESSHGTFYYTPGQINCDFHDKKKFFYRVDEEFKRIDAGNGMWMEKISDN